MKKIISFIIIFSMIISMNIFASADAMDNIVVTLGQDLTQEQRKQMLDYFNVDESARIVEVTNEEEYEYFGDYIDESLIGRKALSSVYVEKLPKGEGITVQTNNIFWVTEDMYRNALVTAGVEDAKIIVSGPGRVSGTAALTGIIKAFENVTGEDISEEEKRTASEEIAKTAKLGDILGKEKAQDLIRDVKIYIINNNIKDKNSIEKVIIDVASNLNIELTEEQINEIVSLMQNISKLDLNIDEIKGQLKDVSNKIDEVLEQNVEVKSFLQRILDAIVNFFNRLFG